jgi:O-methyltransferase domain
VPRPASAERPRPAPGTDAEDAAYATLARMWELADLTLPLTLRAICELGVADELRAGPRPAAALATATGAHAGALARALRALASRGVLAEVAPDVFALAPAGEPLRSDHPLSLRHAYALIAADLHAWAHADHAIRTGRSAFEHVHGRPYYDHLAGDDAARERFDRSVEAQSRLMARALASAYDWAGCGPIVDLAAGTGAFLAELLARHPALEGVVVDLPHVVADAPATLARAGVAERCRAVAGDVFSHVPAGHDTYLLKTVLHDWDDAHALRILRAVAAAMRADSRLLVLEALLPSGDAFHHGKLLDVNSLVLVAGPDRDADALVALLADAGLACRRVVRTATLALFEAARGDARP